MPALAIYFGRPGGFGISDCYASNEASLVKKGNSLYNNGKYDEALKNYEQALTDRPESPLINFNIGNTFYKKGQYKEAIQSYEKALLSEDKKLESKADYNIGNCKFRQGRQKESTDLAGALADYRQSLDYYKRAIEIDQDDKDAKFNHEFVEKLLKSLLDKLSGQQKQQGSAGQGKEGQKEQGKEQQQAKPQMEEQAKGQQAQEEEGKESQSLQNEQKKEQERQKSEQPSELGGEPIREDKGRDKDMSKEEAKILLDDYRQKEQQDRQLSDKHEPVRYPEVEKDW